MFGLVSVRIQVNLLIASPDFLTMVFVVDSTQNRLIFAQKVGYWTYVPSPCYTSGITDPMEWVAWHEFLLIEEKICLFLEFTSLSDLKTILLSIPFDLIIGKCEQHFLSTRNAERLARALLLGDQNRVTQVTANTTPPPTRLKAWASRPSGVLYILLTN